MLPAVEPHAIAIEVGAPSRTASVWLPFRLNFTGTAEPGLDAVHRGRLSTGLKNPVKS